MELEAKIGHLSQGLEADDKGVTKCLESLTAEFKKAEANGQQFSDLDSWNFLALMIQKRGWFSPFFPRLRVCAAGC